MFYYYYCCYYYYYYYYYRYYYIKKQTIITITTIVIFINFYLPLLFVYLLFSFVIDFLRALFPCQMHMGEGYSVEAKF